MIHTGFLLHSVSSHYPNGSQQPQPLSRICLLPTVFPQNIFISGGVVESRSQSVFSLLSQFMPTTAVGMHLLKPIWTNRILNWCLEVTAYHYPDRDSHRRITHHKHIYIFLSLIRQKIFADTQGVCEEFMIERKIFILVLIIIWLLVLVSELID